IQRRLTQLELAARQLADETEAHAKERLTEIESEMETLRKELASLREQWEAEKAGMGDVHEVRRVLEQVQLEYDQRYNAIREKQAQGQQISEEEFQKLYELDVRLKQLQDKLEEVAAVDEPAQE